ncbi:MAG: glycoside hydrolase family 9 protein [Polyangiaceae bacterium]
MVSVADRYQKLVEEQGYRFPFGTGKTPEYPWGSNSFVVNNAMVLALGFDFSKQPKFREGVVNALDYLLGRNAMGQSYVTGYGERPLMHPHHRFWAQQANAKYPAPPPAVLSGGPNSGLQESLRESGRIDGM